MDDLDGMYAGVDQRFALGLGIPILCRMCRNSDCNRIRKVVYLVEIGIDEAGRGAIIGPMVIAAALVTDSDAIWDLGVKDSKQFGSGMTAHRRRERVVETLESQPGVCTMWISVSAGTIDRCRWVGQTLDEIERSQAEILVRRLRARGLGESTSVVFDGTKIFEPLAATLSNARCEKRADALYASVAAASVVAKVQRDRALQSIWQRLGLPVDTKGGGYPSQTTRELIANYERSTGRVFPEVRHSYGGLR